jgi:hypothetical protein
MTLIEAVFFGFIRDNLRCQHSINPFSNEKTALIFGLNTLIFVPKARKTPQKAIQIE